MSSEDPPELAELTASETRYRRLFEAARDGILLLDSDDCRIIDANPFMSEMLGYSHEEMLGKQMWEIGLMEDKPASKETLRRVREETYLRYADLPLFTQAGERWDAEFVSSLYQEGDRTVIQCNIRDITEHKRVAEELAATVARHERQTAMLEERDRLAREIHDTLAQGFMGIVMQMEAAEAALARATEDFADCQAQLEKVQSRVDKARDLARDSLAEARRFVAGLRSPRLESDPLSGALSRFLAQQVLGTGSTGRFALIGSPYALLALTEHSLLRVGQEAIANAVKHAQAKEVLVELTYQPGMVHLRVHDNGIGFDPALSDAGRFGIVGMRERAENADGRLTIRSRSGAGTEVSLALPVPQETGAD